MAYVISECLDGEYRIWGRRDIKTLYLSKNQTPKPVIPFIFRTHALRFMRKLRFQAHSHGIMSLFEIVDLSDLSL